MPTIAQWSKLLSEKIDAQVAYLGRYEARYRNEYVLPFIAAEYEAVYGKRAANAVQILQPPRVGAAGITVDGLTERLTVAGAVGVSEQDRPAAQAVEAAWVACDLDVMHREAHREALIKGRSFAQVDRAADGRAVVGIETADQMAVHRQAGAPYDVDAAMKIYTDEWTGKQRARLFLPGQRVDLVHGNPEPDPHGSNVVTPWHIEGDPQRSTLPGVPVVEFAHMARPMTEPRSEIEPIETLVDAADLIEGLMVFAGHFGAVPIRYGTGMKPLKDAQGNLILKDGKPVLGFDARADQFWASTNDDARFGQLEPASLETFVRWAEHVASRLRAKTSLASTYYSMDLRSHMSAELLKTDEAPMVRRILAMGEKGPFGQAWRRVMALMLAVEHPEMRARVRPRWESAETRIEAQQTDAFVKVTGRGIGLTTAAKKYLGWSDEEIADAVVEGERQAARTAALDLDPMLALMSGSLADTPTAGGVNAAPGNG